MTDDEKTDDEKRKFIINQLALPLDLSLDDIIPIASEQLGLSEQGKNTDQLGEILRNLRYDQA